jgi:hypothetical protein
MSTWTDGEGMWNIRGRFDPVTALSVSSALDTAAEALFAEAVPDSCPSDPIEKQKHLRALAFARLATGNAGSGRPGQPEYVAVIDVSLNGVSANSAASGGDRASAQVVGEAGGQVVGETGGEDIVGGTPRVTWPIPIEVPTAVLAEMIGGANVHTVVVCDGVVLYAPGNLNLGRSTRLANRDQRRALRGLNSNCAVPGCSVSYDRCKLHHIIWWRNGGSTDLDNLIPLCVQHHHKVHDAGWEISLGPNRELTIRFPDGTVRNTGPPRRHAA